MLSKNIKLAAAAAALPSVRAVIRYSPLRIGSLQLWRLAKTRLAWREHYCRFRSVHGFWLEGDTQNMVYKYVYFFGTWEPTITAFILSRLRLGDAFVDVGANIGYYSLLASQVVGEPGHVVAVEASRSIFRELSKNIGLNNAVNVRAVNVAASDIEEELSLFCGPPHNTGMSTTLATWAGEHECTLEGTIRALPLQEILSIEEIKSARFIKIDVEGAEWKVIRGLYPLLDSTRRDLEIILEVSPQEIQRLGGTVAGMIRSFANAGFQPYLIENDYTPRAYLSESPGFPRPQRLRHDITGQADVIFSRIDAEEL